MRVCSGTTSEWGFAGVVCSCSLTLRKLALLIPGCGCADSRAHNTCKPPLTSRLVFWALVCLLLCGPRTAKCLLASYAYSFGYFKC